jgi:cobalamin-dependent methionine synthase I
MAEEVRLAAAAAGSKIEAAARKEDAAMKPLKDALVTGRFKDMAGLVKAALEAGATPQEMLDGALIPGLEEVGLRFSKNLIFIPEMMISAKAMQEALAILARWLAVRREEGARWPSARSRTTCTTWQEHRVSMMQVRLMSMDLAWIDRRKI